MKKVTILFPFPHLSYSPTVIGLHDLLSTQFEVSIVAPHPIGFNNQPLPNRNVIYLPEKPFGGVNRYFGRLQYEWRSLFLRELSAFKHVRHSFLHEFDFIKTYLARERPDQVIAVDFKNLLYTQLMGQRVDFLSLEIIPNDVFYDQCSFQNIDSVIIQSQDRYDHLFDNLNVPTFYIQNAPVYSACSNHTQRRGLVYSGTATNGFGFYHLLEFLKAFPEHTLTVKGAVLDEDRKHINTQYADLVAEGVIVIDDGYLDDADVVDYLRRFRIGFCFYNFELAATDHFNYRTAPSGKMFKYFAAGVPVIGIDIPGLSPVKEFECGVLIPDLQPDTIRKAVDTIENDFERYSENCLKAAEHYSFDKMARPFVEYLANK